MNSITEDVPKKTESKSVTTFKETFNQHIEDIDTTPGWWRRMKREAFEAFLETPMPKRKDESWRFASLSNLSFAEFDYGKPPSIANAQELVEKSNVLEHQSGSFIFADNQTIDAEKASFELQQKGVIWTSLREATSKHGELLKDYFMKQEVHLGSEKFALLHSAFVENGVLLYVPKGVEIEYPFLSYNWITRNNAAAFPHTLIIAEEFSKVSLVEAHFSTTEEAPALSCGVTHLFAGVGAKIDYTLLQDYNEETLGFQINSNIAGKDSTVKSLSVNVGCRNYRSETHGQIKGDGAQVEMLSLAVADEDQEIDQRTLQTHSAANANSNLLFKNALKDKAKTIFSGLIKVDDGAQHTDAYQTNRNLLLSNTAEANSLPGLEIEANDVKCSHGATTSQIEEDEIFYMLARGIPKEKAQELIVYGFFEEILERIEDEKLTEVARSIIQTKFSSK